MMRKKPFYSSLPENALEMLLSHDEDCLIVCMYAHLCVSLLSSICFIFLSQVDRASTTMCFWSLIIAPTCYCNTNNAYC